MAYIGREPLGGEVIIMDSIESQFNGVLTTFNLTRTVSGVTTAFYPVGSQQLLVSLGGVIQRPDPTGNTGFRISFNTIIFAVAPSASTSCFIISYGNLIDIGAPANNTVTTDKLVDGSVTPAKLSAGGPSWNTSGTLGIVNPNYYSGSYPWYINQNSTNGYLAINYYGNTNNFVIRDNGNVGIATASPGTKLHVNGPVKIGEGVATNTSKLLVNTLAGTAAGIQLFQDATESWIIQNPASSADLTFGASGTERLRITSAGLMGLGTNAPNRKLEVSDAGVDNFIRVNTTGATKSGIEFASSGTVYSQLYFTNVSPYDLSLLQQYTTGSLILGTNSTERARIDSSGRLLVGTSSANASGAKLQTADGLTFPATQVASADPNTLDDYEEGTWTPSVGGTATYSAQRGTYTKIGKVVHFSAVLVVNTIGTGSITQVTGLPFTSAVLNDGNVYVGYFGTIATSIVHLGGDINTSAVTINFYSTTAAAATTGGSAIFGNGAQVNFS